MIDKIVLQIISIHSPHARGDRQPTSYRQQQQHFNPLPSCEGRPLRYLSRRAGWGFQSTPLMRGETRYSERFSVAANISIHSPHARGDFLPIPFFCTTLKISIHSPHARGDLSTIHLATSTMHFNPLPSCEGRLRPRIAHNIIINFNPLPSCEGRRPCCRVYSPLIWISIHSPHARGDVNLA